MKKKDNWIMDKLTKITGNELSYSEDTDRYFAKIA
jgi:hypothetical protein